MYACLNPGFGWTWGPEKGPFVLSDIYRYAGMLAGQAPDGRICARPISEVTSLSLDGEIWFPFYELRGAIPWENHVQQALHLPSLE